MPTTSSQAPGQISRLVQAAAAVIVIFALRYTKEVMVPLALSVLFTFLLGPLVNRLERRRIPRVPAVLLVVIMAFALMGTLGYMVAVQVRDLSTKLPSYAANIEHRVKWVKQFTDGALSRISHEAQTIATNVTTTAPPATSPSNPFNSMFSRGDEIQKVQIVSSSPPLLTTLIDTIGPAIDVVASGFVVTILCIFMLLQREDLRDRLLKLVSNGQLLVTTQAMDEASARVSRYLLMQSIINSIYGTMVMIGLLILQIPYAPLWGLLAGVLRFMPYVGPWLGAALPVTLSIALAGDMRPVLTLGLFVILEIICGSVLEPWLYGSHTGVSSIAILAAAVFWAWLWGVVGLLLATPLTVVLVVLGKYVPHLQFLNVLLGDEPAFDPPTRYYQRLLASDPEEATELVDEYLKTQPLANVYESVLIPALGLVQRDHFQGLLADEKERFIHRTMKEQVEELGERPVHESNDLVETSITARLKAESSAKSNARSQAAAKPPDDKIVHTAKVSGASEVQILCLPSRDEADEVAGIMFAQVLERTGYKAQAVSVSALASEMVELVCTKAADIVVISALPPSAVQHARYLAKRLNARCPNARVLVGLWTAQGDMARSKERMTLTDQDSVAINFTEALEAIHQMIQPLLLKRAAHLGSQPIISKMQTPQLSVSAT